MVTGSLPLPAEHGQPDDAPGGQRGGDVRFPLDGTVVPDIAPPRCACPAGFHPSPGRGDVGLHRVRGEWSGAQRVRVHPPGQPAGLRCRPRGGRAGRCHRGLPGSYLPPPGAVSARADDTPGPLRPDGRPRRAARSRARPPDRPPGVGEPGAKRTLARPGKRNRQEQEAPRKEQEAPRKAARFVPRAAAIGVAIAVVLAGAAAAVLSRAHGGPSNPPALVSFQPSALSFPAVPVNSSITRSVTVTNNGSSPVTITRISIGGPSQHDFSVRRPDLLRLPTTVARPSIQPRKRCRATGASRTRRPARSRWSSPHRRLGRAPLICASTSLPPSGRRTSP